MECCNDYKNYFIDKMKIIKNNLIAFNIYELILEGNFPTSNPGQFIMISTDRFNGLLLRRPFSICNNDYKNKQITIIYKVLGQGTNYIAMKNKNDFLEVFGPLGNGFQTNNLEKNQTVLLLGGGIGVAPLYNLLKKLKEKNIQIINILGFKNKEEMFYIEKFDEYGKTIICTDDGSFGYKGFIMDYLNENKINFNCLYSCGPNLMLKEINDKYLNMVNQNIIDGYLSFEERMACGIGSCLGCAIKKSDSEEFLRVCKDGPVFKLGVVNPWK